MTSLRIDVAGERARWFCLRPDGVPIVQVVDGRTYVLDYCGAPAGIRCSCRKPGHDLGDEDGGAG